MVAMAKKNPPWFVPTALEPLWFLSLIISPWREYHISLLSLRLMYLCDLKCYFITVLSFLFWMNEGRLHIICYHMVCVCVCVLPGSELSGFWTCSENCSRTELHTEDQSSFLFLTTPLMSFLSITPLCVFINPSSLSLCFPAHLFFSHCLRDGNTGI